MLLGLKAVSRERALLTVRKEWDKTRLRSRDPATSPARSGMIGISEGIKVQSSRFREVDADQDNCHLGPLARERA